ncbi:DUF262 domain-containing protein [Vibrio sp. ED002]|uniref:DUF262 domain-containing protein n=1 Tax=Vibrio sp. ED002 TaxID=2785123 RepID=UPI00200F60E9|nr:DUF262 domain-containing protein [Vibrio sp. ED002]UQA51969.1 DUF262 domain-containing HNH endonuclease family protein [Vibrio sp. ED002]
MMKSLSTLLSSRTYFIPKNQRGYSWTPKEIDDLLGDVSLMGNKSHYMGTIICSKQESFFDEITGAANIKFILEDGQQRLTTFLIIINEIRKKFIDIDGAESLESQELSRLISFKNDGKRLRVENENTILDSFFKSIIGEGEVIIPQDKTPSMRHLEKAVSHLRAYLSSYENREELLKFKNKVCNQVLIIDVDLSDALVDRYLTFDAINSRGLPLTEFDKIKNFCILVCERRELNIKVEDEWYKSISNLEKYGVGSRGHENSFIAEAFSLYHNTSASNSDVHEKFVKEYRSLLDGENNKKILKLSGFINLLSSYSVSFGLVNSSKKQLYIGELCNEDGFNWMNSIDRLGLSGITKRVLATAHYSYDFEDFASIARACEIYTFRMHALWRYRVDKCSKDIMELSHKILCDNFSCKDAIKYISTILVENANLISCVSKLSTGEINYNNWSYLYYFLFEYEKSKSAYPTLDWQTNDKAKRDSIEHILPQVCETWWIEHWPNQLQAEKWSHRIGNLVLTKGNSILARKSIRKKLKDDSAEYYYLHDSATNCEKLIANFTDGSKWQHSEILSREVDMINFALERWSIPCIQDSGVINLDGEYKKYLPNCSDIEYQIEDGINLEVQTELDVSDIIVD